MWLGRDEHVEPEISVRRFGPAAFELPVTIKQRIAQLRRDWIERRKYVTTIIIKLFVVLKKV